MPAREMLKTHPLHPFSIKKSRKRVAITANANRHSMSSVRELACEIENGHLCSTDIAFGNNEKNIHTVDTIQANLSS
jgi:hypothetical protein